VNDPYEFRPRRWYVATPLVLWKYCIGVILCQHPMTALLVVGWTGRTMQLRALRLWWKQSPQFGQGVSFNQFTATLSQPITRRAFPNWCLGESRLPTQLPAQAIAGGSICRFLRPALGALGANFSQGFRATLCIFLFTLPATSLWLYAWVLGWNISFFKLYEQSALGISLGLFGILLFIVAMLYVPLAHARQAVTGEWRAFFDFHFNWKLVRRSAASMLPVALLFVVASGVIMILRTAPYTIGSAPQFDTLSVEQLHQWLVRYHLAAGAVLFPAYVLVWLSVAKTYARAVVLETRDNSNCQDLRTLEREAFCQLQLPPQESRMTNSPLLRGASWTVGQATSGAIVLLTCLCWFAVAAELFIAQFFNYQPGIAWLYHPLVLLPWIKYLPPSLVP
jgi:hypothetical protein